MKKRIAVLLLTLCVMAIGFIPCTASAGDNRTVTVNAGVGGLVSVDGQTWSKSVTVSVKEGNKLGDRVVYKAEDGYEFDDISSSVNIVAISAGASYTLILDDKGRIYTAGDNGYGQRAIGDPTTMASSQYSTWYFSKATNGIDGVKIKAIAAGSNHTVVLSEDGDVYTAGWNVKGQLGRDVSDALKAKYPTLTSIPYENSFAKVTVGDGTVKIKAIAAGAEHTVLVDENGKVWTAGYNYLKLLGRTLSGRLEYEAAFGQAEGEVNNVTIVAAASGSDQTVLLDSDGGVWTVGQSFYGANGQGGKRPAKFTKCSIDGNPKIVAIAAGEKHMVLLDENGNVYTTGYNTSGQLGLGNNTQRNTFAKVDLDVKIVSVDAGKNHTVLVDENGKVYAAGDNTYGQLGLPLATASVNVFTPVTVEGLGENRIVSAAASNVYSTNEAHTVLLDSAGRIWTAGSHSHFQLAQHPCPQKSPEFKLAMSSPVLRQAITDLSEFVVTDNSTVFVNFKEREKVNITYNLSLGSWVTGFTPPTFCYKGDSFTPPALSNLVREGYTAKEWKIASQTDTSITYRVVWEEKSGYTIKYDTKGGTTIGDKTGVKWNDEVLDGINAPTRDGWEFIGWTCDGSPVDESMYPCYCDLADNDTVMSITLVAGWKDILKPVITGLTDGETYCASKEFTVSDNDGIASVTVNGRPIRPQDGKYTVSPAQGEQTVTVTDNTGNSTVVKVTVNDGHTPAADDGDCTTAVKCTVCDVVVVAAKNAHTYGEWTSDGNGKHSRRCTVAGCTAGVETENCSGGRANCVIAAICDVCKKPYGNTDSGNHFRSIGWVKTETSHIRVWLCCERIETKGPHNWENGVCRDCGYICTHKDGTAEWTIKNETDHERKYSCCGAVTVAKEKHEWTGGVCSECGYVCKHKGGTATCTEKASCTVCGEKYGELAPHSHTVKNTDAKYLKSAATCTKKAVYYYSCICGEKDTETFESGRTSPHSYGNEWVIDESSHYRICSVCKAKTDADAHTFEWKIDKEASVSEAGEKHEECTVCGYKKESVVIDKPAPGIVEGNGKKWSKGDKDGLEFRFDGALSDIVEVLVDGKTVAPENYEKSEDGTAIELKASYLETLDEGEHTLTIRSANGDATAKFTVEAENVSPVSDSSNSGIRIIVAAVAILAVGIVIVVIVIIARKRNKKSK